MIRLPQASEHRNLSSKARLPAKAELRDTPWHKAPPVVPAAKTVVEIECAGEAPLEALRNSGMC
jgi:hypothetical protein